MRIAIGCDHRGVKLKQAIIKYISESGHSYEDFGCFTGEPVDYPDTAYLAAKAVAAGEADRAILVCGTGIGMSIAANKIKGIRAALCYDELAARLSRQHNDANVLCLSGDLVGHTMMRKTVETWLTTKFESGRHQRRVRKIQAIEEGTDPREITTSQ